MFVAINKHQRFKSFINQTTSIKLNYSSSNTEKSFVSNCKISDDIFQCGLRCFQLCDGFLIVCKLVCNLRSFLFETNREANIAAHLSIRPNVNGKRKRTGFVKFLYQYLVDIC